MCMGVGSLTCEEYPCKPPKAAQTLGRSTTHPSLPAEEDGIANNQKLYAEPKPAKKVAPAAAPKADLGVGFLSLVRGAYRTLFRVGAEGWLDKQVF